MDRATAGVRHYPCRGYGSRPQPDFVPPSEIKPLADSRQRVADEHVDDAAATKRGLEQDERRPARRRIAPTMAASAAERACAKRFERLRRRPPARRRRPACPRWRRTAGRCRGSRMRRRPAAVRAAPPRSARPRCPHHARARSARSRARRGSGRASSGRRRRVRAAQPSSSWTGAVSLSMSASSLRSPRAIITAMPWSPSVPETSTRSPGRTCSARRSTPRATSPIAGCVDVDAVGVPALDDLRIAGRDRHAGSVGRPRHVRRRPVEGRRRRTPPRSRSPRRATDGTAPETARSLTVPLTARSPIDPAREEDRLDDVRVGREGEPRPVEVERSPRRRAARAPGSGTPRGTALPRARASPCRRRRARA